MARLTFRRPVDDSFRVTSPFGPRGDGFHGALDLGNFRTGDPVRAAAAGRVLAAGALLAPWSSPSSRFPSGNYGGLMVVIEHAPRVVSIYAHLGAIVVAAGQSVNAGQLLGVHGDTGAAAPPPLGGGGHLHFGIQAPPAAVPAGLATHATPFGFGLDVDPWPLITGAAALDVPSEVMLFTITARVAESWHTVTGRPFYTLAGELKHWADPVEAVDSVAELLLDDGTPARLVPYGAGEPLIVPRRSLDPIRGTRVDPAAAIAWYRGAAAWLR